MNHELLESRLKNYFEHEADRGDISPDQWRHLISEAVTHSQRHRGRWARNPLRLVLRRPHAATAATLVVAVVIGGMSLWISGFWQSFSSPYSPSSPGVVGLAGAPGIVGVPGPGARPGPRYFDVSWTIEKRLYVPGDSITITLTLKNIYHQPIKFNEISVTPLLARMGIPPDDKAPLAQAVLNNVPELLLPGEELVLPIIVPSALTSNLATGRYAMSLDLRIAKPGDTRIAKPGDTPELDSESRLGMNSGTLFVIVPPEGALIKTVQVGEVRQAGGITVTLESIRFGPEETTIVMIVALPDRYRTENPVNSSDSDTAPASTRASSDPEEALPTTTPASPATPAPAATAAPRAPGGDIRGTTARYRVDGGAWQELAFFESDGPPEAMYVEWTMGSVPLTARTFEFSVTGIKIIPDEDVTGPWEWTVPLQDE